jgi:hypothetical protein
MTRMTLSQPLSQPLSNWTCVDKGCGNVSAYFAELVRQRRQAQIDSDTRFLAEAIKDAPPGPEPVDQLCAEHIFPASA